MLDEKEEEIEEEEDWRGRMKEHGGGGGGGNGDGLIKNNGEAGTVVNLSCHVLTVWSGTGMLERNTIQFSTV